jgi:hypothetical protein
MRSANLYKVNWMLRSARMYRYTWDGTILTISDADRFVTAINASSRHPLQIASGHLLASREAVGIDQGTSTGIKTTHNWEFTVIDHQSQKGGKKSKKFLQK